MGNVIGHNGPGYDTNMNVEGERPIRTTVKLPGRSKDAFSHKASVRHAKIDGRPQDYEDMAGGHKEERD